MPTLDVALHLLVRYANGSLFKRPIILQTTDDVTYGIATDEESLAYVKISDITFSKPVAINFEDYKQIIGRKKITGFQYDGQKITMSLSKQTVDLQLHELQKAMDIPTTRHRNTYKLHMPSFMTVYRQLGIDTFVNEVVVGRYIIMRTAHFDLASPYGLEASFSVQIRPFAHALKLFEALDSDYVNVIRSNSLVLYTDEAICIMPYLKDTYDDLPEQKYLCSIPKSVLKPDKNNEIEILKNTVFVNGQLHSSEPTLLHIRKVIPKKLSNYIIKNFDNDIFVGLTFGKAIVLTDYIVTAIVY